jgi:hypothetical protein
MGLVLIGSEVAAQTLRRKHRSEKSVERRGAAAVERGSAPRHIATMRKNASHRPRTPALPHPVPASPPATGTAAPKPREIGGPKGPEPTRYGDWEIGGRCIDF